MIQLWVDQISPTIRRSTRITCQVWDFNGQDPTNTSRQVDNPFNIEKFDLLVDLLVDLLDDLLVDMVVDLSGHWTQPGKKQVTRIVDFFCSV